MRRLRAVGKERIYGKINHSRHCPDGGRIHHGGILRAQRPRRRLRGHPAAGPRAIINETGFTPNIHTRRLNLKRSFTVHVVLRQYDFSLFNLFAMDVLTGIFRESKSLGYSVIFTSVENEAECSELMDAIHGKEADGVIFIQVFHEKVVQLLQAEQFPFLCVDCHVPRDGHGAPAGGGLL